MIVPRGIAIISATAELLMRRKQRAQAWQTGLASETTHDNTDLGFKLFDTYGVAYQLTGKVQDGSVRTTADGMTFRVRDRDGAASVPVSFAAIRRQSSL